MPHSTHIFRRRSHAPTNHQLNCIHVRTHARTHIYKYCPNRKSGSEVRRKNISKNIASEKEEERDRENRRANVNITKICSHIPADVGIFQLFNENRAKKTRKLNNKTKIYKRFGCRCYCCLFPRSTLLFSTMFFFSSFRISLECCVCFVLCCVLLCFGYRARFGYWFQTKKPTTKKNTKYIYTKR